MRRDVIGILARCGACESNPERADTWEPNPSFRALFATVQQNASVEILRSGEVPAANPEFPAEFSFGTVVGNQSNLRVPAALSFIVGLLDDELIEDARDTGKRYRPRDPTALDDDPDAIAQLVDRFGKIDRRSAALVIVATNQGEQCRRDRRQIDRVARKQCERDRLQSPRPQLVEIGLAVPCLTIAHATSSRSRRSRFTFPQR